MSDASSLEQELPARRRRRPSPRRTQISLSLGRGALAGGVVAAFVLLGLAFLGGLRAGRALEHRAPVACAEAQPLPSGGGPQAAPRTLAEERGAPRARAVEPQLPSAGSDPSLAVGAVLTSSAVRGAPAAASRRAADAPVSAVDAAVADAAPPSSAVAPPDAGPPSEPRGAPQLLAAVPAYASEPPATGWGLQVGAYPTKGEADYVLREVAPGLPGLPLFVLASDVPGKGRWYRVRAGRFASRAAAEAARARLGPSLKARAIVVSYK